MSVSLRDRYASGLALVHTTMADEAGHWDWGGLDFVEKTVRGLLQREGKLLRPLLALAFTELFGGEQQRACAPAASVEFYHLAALVLDDVQDNSTVRRGAPTVHMTSSMSTAINVSGIIRSLSYHPIHRSPWLSPGEKSRLHAELDRAATHIVMGQAIDIGWHEDWYRSPADFPYEPMIRGKTGALFGCAAAMGACVSGADPGAVGAAREFGISLGALYQLADDYLDVFGPSGGSQRPLFEDFRGGKMSAPVIGLLAALESAGDSGLAGRVLRRLADHTSSPDWDWLLGLMNEHAVGESLRDDLTARADALRAGARRFGGHTAAGVLEIVDLVAASFQAGGRTPVPAGGQDGHRL